MINQPNLIEFTFPIKGWRGIFYISSFRPDLVDNRIQESDIRSLLSAIYQATDNLAPYRKAACKGCCYFLALIGFNVSMFIVVALGFSLGKNWMGLIGIGVMVASFFIWPVLMASMNRKLMKELPEYYKKILEVIETNNQKFQAAGLRWVVPQDMKWLELWMDYKLLGQQQPFYMPPPQYFNQAQQGQYPDIPAQVRQPAISNLPQYGNQAYINQ